ncbi:MAG: hypothetical protein ACKPKO_63235, partial [Candidatus Fonsibacter sp.]
RRLIDIAAPAELAAKLTARPKIREICQALTTAGLMTQNHLTNYLDEKNQRVATDIDNSARPNRSQTASHLDTTNLTKSPK